jgi:hypothetical protein
VKRIKSIILAAILPFIILIPTSEYANPENICKGINKKYGNFSIELYDLRCFKISPFYFKGGITQKNAEKNLIRLGIVPISIITGGFHTGTKFYREPIDYVEIEGKVIVGRSGAGYIIFEARGNRPYLDIVRGRVVYWKFENGIWLPVFDDIPEKRNWAIAAWPYLKVSKEKNGEIIVNVFGNDTSDKPWITYMYTIKNKKISRFNSIVHLKNWNYSRRRILLDWTERRAIFINENATVFAVIKGRADTEAISKLMIILGFNQAIMLDGGYSTSPHALNPVYLVVTKR